MILGALFASACQDYVPPPQSIMTPDPNGQPQELKRYGGDIRVTLKYWPQISKSHPCYLAIILPDVEHAVIHYLPESDCLSAGGKKQ